MPPSPLRPRTIRCAIYTRKSSEEGLEQDFNSLHAQREACEAFVKSQRHEGWVCLPQAYDDGGISGGTMDRPALQQLLADIKARQVDVVVVYKVDRLTRSLADFAKMVEIFDAHGVSFVSVTQQFNTTSSMGRLTLNVLLSFAQFEREVTGERIRDKIAASKKKGMWMGGVPPLGYDVRDRKLVVNEQEAETVRHIFQGYRALGSVRLLKEALDAAGIVSKLRQTTGKHRGGKPMQRGALYRLLQNRLYRGEITHKGQSYPGEHPAIIAQDLWDAAQARLAANAVEHDTGAGARSPSLLAGLLFDDAGHRMTPSHAVKNGQRYRYYVSQPLTTGRHASGRRVPATEIEQLVANGVRHVLADEAAMFETIAPSCSDVAGQKRLLEQAASLAAAWPTMTASRQRGMLMAVIRRVVLGSAQVDIHLAPARFAALLRGDIASPAPEQAPDERSMTLTVPAELKRIGAGAKMVIGGGDPYAAATPDPAMLKLLARAWDLQQKLLAGQSHSLRSLAESQRLNESYATRLLRLTYLAPDIITAILGGRQPPALTAIKLMRGTPLPMDWPAQRIVLGFGTG